MGTLVAFEWLSLDGVFEADSMADWFFPYDSPGRRRTILETYQRADALLMGRTTYEMLAPSWSSMADDEMDGLAGVLTHTPKHIASDGPAIADWGQTTTFGGDAVPEVQKLKDDGGTLMLIGSGALATTLAQAGLVDEYILLVQPFVMGTGRRFIGEEMQTALELVQVTQLDQGQLWLHYRVKRG